VKIAWAKVNVTDACTRIPTRHFTHFATDFGEIKKSCSPHNSVKHFFFVSVDADTESHSLVKAVHEVLPYFLHFSTTWIKFGTEMSTKTYLVTASFVINITAKAILYLQASTNLCLYLPHLLCDLLGTRYKWFAHIPVSVYVLRSTRHREGTTFHTDVKKITFTPLPIIPYDICKRRTPLQNLCTMT